MRLEGRAGNGFPKGTESVTDKRRFNERSNPAVPLTRDPCSRLTAVSALPDDGANKDRVLEEVHGTKIVTCWGGFGCFEYHIQQSTVGPRIRCDTQHASKDHWRPCVRTVEVLYYIILCHYICILYTIIHIYIYIYIFIYLYTHTIHIHLMSGSRSQS